MDKLTSALFGDAQTVAKVMKDQGIVEGRLKIKEIIVGNKLCSWEAVVFQSMVKKSYQEIVFPKNTLN